MSAIAWGVAGVVLIGLFVFFGIRSARRRDAARAEERQQILEARIARGLGWDRAPSRVSAASRSRTARSGSASDRRSGQDRRASSSSDDGVLPVFLDSGSDLRHHSAAWGSTGGSDDASSRGGFDTGGSHSHGSYATGGGFGGESYSSSSYSSSDSSSSSSSCGSSSSDSGSSGCGGGGGD